MTAVLVKALRGTALIVYRRGGGLVGLFFRGVAAQLAHQGQRRWGLALAV